MLEYTDRILFNEKCGIFGLYGKGMEAARLTYAGLWALQHRGQESSGISAADGKTIRTHKNIGLVAHVYEEKHFENLSGYIAIGHNRYSTSGGMSSDHNQPVTHADNTLVLAHNGNLPSTKKLEKFLTSHHAKITGRNDSELMYDAILYYMSKGLSVQDAVTKSFPLFTGVFSLLVMTKDTLIGVRDIHGIRPFSLGRLNGGYVLTSETCALNTINAEFIREVLPGEMIVLNKKGLSSYQLAPGKQKLDIFEFIYFARPDSMMLGKSVNEVRRNLGKNLAAEHVLRADVVIPVPDSAIPAALGYAQASGIPFDHGLIKNRYIHRTFIRPAQRLREQDVELKLNPLPQVLYKKDVIVVDDSIVRGTTSKKLVALLRKAGARKVHLLVSCPPIKYPDFYGIDTPEQKDLIGARMSIDEIKDTVEADSVGFLSYDGLIDATGLREEVFSAPHFNGHYPSDIGERAEGIDFSI